MKRCVSYDMNRNISNISYETAYETPFQTPAMQRPIVWQSAFITCYDLLKTKIMTAASGKVFRVSIWFTESKFLSKSKGPDLLSAHIQPYFYSNPFNKSTKIICPGLTLLFGQHLDYFSHGPNSCFGPIFRADLYPFIIGANILCTHARCACEGRHSGH